jgi:DNA modification methylase
MPGIVVYVWSAPLLEGAAMLEGLISAGIHVQSQIIWVKPSLILGQSDYQWRHEMCWYGYAKGMKRQWNGGRTETTVWECSRENDGIHPTQKPVAIMAKSVRNSSKASNIVADPFLGSGTTMIACEQLGRRCFGMEIEPRYVDVCVKRWEALTGKKAVLISE